MRLQWGPAPVALHRADHSHTAVCLRLGGPGPSGTDVAHVGRQDGCLVVEHLTRLRQWPTSSTNSWASLTGTRLTDRYRQSRNNPAMVAVNTTAAPPGRPGRSPLVYSTPRK
jgi:hypothetical protein